MSYIYYFVLFFTTINNFIFKLSQLTYTGLDGWCSPNGLSIWNFVITTSDKKEYLYKLEDLSGERHTAEIIAEKIEDVMTKIGPQKIVALLSDSGANISSARAMVKNKYL